MAKPGRNDPCPCGSGKKYKNCCQNTKIASTIPPAWGQDPEWRKIRSTEGELTDAILGFGMERYGDGFMNEVFDEFGIWGEYSIDQKYLDAIIVPWAAFSWIPEPDDAGLSSLDAPEQPLGLEFLSQNIIRLDEYQTRFIHTACAEPFTFFAVTSVVAGKSLGLHDVFLDRTFTVKEAAASRTLKRGDLIFARVVELDGQAIVVGMGPIAIPPREHVRILEIRDEIKKEMREEGYEFNIESLRVWDLEMRDVYLGAAEYLANPPRPELRNTDGDPISLVKLYFDLLCTPQEAFDGLKSLSLSQEGILEGSTRDERGDLHEVSFDWAKKGNKKHKSWENTILGNLNISGKTLTAEVNSEKRAKRIQSEITKRLGKKAIFMRAVHESLDARLEEVGARSQSPEFRRAEAEQEEFASRPEVKAFLEQQMKAHLEAWYTERVPALQNKTPLEAARTKAGRERLDALLVDFERRNSELRESESHLRVDVQAMRKRLGL